MENNAPRGQPRREPILAGPVVAAAQVDPCIAYFEVNEADDAQTLIACWARSSNEVQKVGGKTQLKLNHVYFLMASPLPIDKGILTSDNRPPWHFVVHELDNLMVESDQAGISLCINFRGKIIRGSRAAIKFIDRATDSSLEKLAFGKSRMERVFIERLLELAPADWTWLSNARAFLQTSQLPDIGECTEPKGSQLMYNCGEALYKSGHYKAATEMLQLLLKEPDLRYKALNLIGLSFMKMGMHEFAIKRLDIAASEMEPMDECKKEIVYSLGLAYQAAEQPAKALEQWKRIYEVDLSYRDVSKRVEKSYGF